MVTTNADDSYAMRITHVNFGIGFGGSEQQTLLLIQGLARRRVLQRLLIPAGSALRQRARYIDRLEIVTIHKPYALSIRQAQGSDILHAHDPKAARWCARVRKVYSIPFLLTHRSSSRPKKNRTMWATYNQATCVIALSRAITEVLHSYQPQLPVERIPDMYNPLEPDPTEVQQLRQCYRGKYVVGHIGTLHSQIKGQHHLLEAARLLAPRYPQMRFVFVGGGRDAKMLAHQARFIDGVEFVGFRDSVQEYFALFDQFVFPALHSGLGSCLVDAMHHRLPIVASSVGGIADLIQDKVTGLLVPARSPQALAEAIESIYLSSSLAAQIGQQAYNASEHYSVEHLSDRVFLLYQSALAQRF